MQVASDGAASSLWLRRCLDAGGLLALWLSPLPRGAGLKRVHAARARQGCIRQGYIRQGCIISLVPCLAGERHDLRHGHPPWQQPLACQRRRLPVRAGRPLVDEHHSPCSKYGLPSPVMALITSDCAPSPQLRAGRGVRRRRGAGPTTWTILDTRWP